MKASRAVLCERRFARVVPLALSVAICAVLVPASARTAAAFGTVRVSTNWSGYEQKPPANVSYTAVQAQFIVPAVDTSVGCQNTADPCAKSSTWVGIGGDPVPLVQTGTEADLKQGGTAAYWAWAEIVPDNPNTQVILKVPVAPGDGVLATVRETASGTWVMTVRNLTTGKSASRMVTNYPVTQSSSSAEVIHEATGGAPLTPTSDVVFDNASYATSAPGTSPTWVPFFQMPTGATMYEEQMCVTQATNNQACAGSPPEMAAMPSEPDSDNNGFAVADGAQTPPPPQSVRGLFSDLTDPSISQAVSVVLGPDGAMWFTNFGSNQIGRVARDGTITMFSGSAICGPEQIISGPDGALWFVNECLHGAYNGGIGRITTSGSSTEFDSLDPGMQPYSLTAGPDGAIWFTNGPGSTSSIGRLTTSGSFTFYTDPSIVNPGDIVTGPDKSLWFTNQGSLTGPTLYQGSSIGRITTLGTVSSYTNTTIDDPSGITVGPDKALWFSNSAGGSIGRITTSGLVSSYPTPSGIPMGLATGPDGAIWAIDFGGRRSIDRITISGHLSHYYDGTPTATGPAYAAPPGLGFDGRMWFPGPTATTANNPILRVSTL